MEVQPIQANKEVKHLEHPYMVTREEWGAYPHTYKEPVNHPVNHVRLQYTGGRVCRNKEDCCKLMRELQKEHMEIFKLPDIQFNFMVVPSGVIYEGRGWDRCAFRADKHDRILKNDMINIGFIGNYKTSLITPQMDRATVMLAEYAKYKGYIIHDTILYSQRCANVDGSFW